MSKTRFRKHRNSGSGTNYTKDPISEALTVFIDGSNKMEKPQWSFMGKFKSLILSITSAQLVELCGA